MTFGPSYSPTLDGPRLAGQIARVYQAMRDRRWRTLSEIEALTHDPAASISAQLRHLRKTRFGSYVVEKRRRCTRSRGIWEYRVSPPVKPGQALLFGEFDR